jgi:NNP family nitrate/nitrite transporter-like MFS transporter
MQQKPSSIAYRILSFNTLAFTVCFAGWVLNGVLIAFLIDNGIVNWTLVQAGWLLGIPVLTGSIMRLPMGLLTDKFGGRWVFSGLMLFCAIPLFLLSFTTDYTLFLVLSFLFGLLGASFAVGVGFTSLWFPPEWQGRALGIFGVGNVGSAITTMVAPSLLIRLTDNGADPEGWRTLPIMYAIALVIMAILFILFTQNKKPASSGKSLKLMLQPLKNVRVWRFGLYYFLVFGCFVTFSQWLVSYFLNVYNTSLVTAGLLASCFSLPAGLFRAVGGWLSDKFGARMVMYWVLSGSLVLSFLLVIPRMEIYSPGAGLMATAPGTVSSAGPDHVTVGDKTYPLQARSNRQPQTDTRQLIFPTKESWQEAVVKPGDAIKKKQMLAQGVTRIYFQANVWVFVGLIMLMGMVWGIGTAAVFKHIPEYFPDEVGIVGGMVGLIGGLGGFIGPILFGYLLSVSGLWTSSWFFVCLLSALCLIWMHAVITRMMKKGAPHLANKFELPHKTSGPPPQAATTHV